MALERWFRRNRPTRKEDDNAPAGLWLKCEACNAQIYRKDLVANAYVCPECGHHYRMPVEARVELLTDAGTFEPWSGEIEAEDPLGFVDTQPYPERLEKNRQKHGRPDAVQTGAGLLDGQPIALVVMDFFFLGGSMGSVVGEEIARAAERAAAERRSLVVVTASGGARMQEGALSLMQMAKTTVALEALSARRLPYISVLTDPTTGGVTASFATLGDVIYAEPGALISFAAAGSPAPARSRRMVAATRSLSALRGTTSSTMPFSSRNSERWKPSGSSCLMVCWMTRGPANEMSAPGSETMTSPRVAKLAVTPPVVGSVSTLR